MTQQEPIMITTIDSVPGRAVVEVLGAISGVGVAIPNDDDPSRTLEALAEASSTAVGFATDSLIEFAQQEGANAVVGLVLSTSMTNLVYQDGSVVREYVCVAYGTAVVVY